MLGTPTKPFLNSGSQHVGREPFLGSDTYFLAARGVLYIFLNIFFGVTCPFWLSLLFSFFFCHQVVHLIHLVFR
jgi:hypothetical protein